MHYEWVRPERVGELVWDAGLPGVAEEVGGLIRDTVRDSAEEEIP